MSFLDVFYDEVNECLIFKSKVFKKLGLSEELKISLSSIKEIKKGILIKSKYIQQRIYRGKEVLAMYLSNFGIKYLYLLIKNKDFPIFTFKLENAPIDYLIVSLPKNVVEMLKLKAELKIKTNF